MTCGTSLAHSVFRNAVASTSCSLLLLFGWVAPLTAQRILPITRDLKIDGDVQDLSRIGELLVSRKGVIAVLLPQDMTIRFFDANGKSLGKFGRRGEGPGEFPMTPRIGWVGDTLFAEEEATRRYTFIGPDLKMLRTTPRIQTILPPATRKQEASVGGESVLITIEPDGSYRLVFSPTIKTVLPAWWPTSASDELELKVKPSGEYLSFVAWPAAVSDDEQCRWGPQKLFQPFCTFYANTNWNPWGSAEVTRVAAGDQSNRYRLRVLSRLQSKVVFDRIYPFTPLPIPDRVVDSTKAEFERQNRTPQAKANFRAVPFAKHYPPVETVYLGSDGVVWLEEHAGITTAPIRWRLLDARGELIGVAIIPRNVYLYQVRRDTAWGVETDAEGAESIVRYRVGG